MKFCISLTFVIAIVIASVFALNGGPIDSTAEAKAKYFSGKTNNSRLYRRSGKKYVRHHRNNTRHYRGNRIKQRTHINKRYRSNHRRIHQNRYARFNRQAIHHHRLSSTRPSVTRSSITNVQHFLAHKRTAKFGISNHPHRKHYRGRYNRIKKVTVIGTTPAPYTKLDQFISRDDATGVSIIYYDGKKCDQGYDCVMRVGLKRSSAKIIVVGIKGHDPISDDNDSPRIIYPPN